jgi:hypothetical protein
MMKLIYFNYFAVLYVRWTTIVRVCQGFSFAQHTKTEKYTPNDHKIHK